MGGKGADQYDRIPSLTSYWKEKGLKSLLSRYLELC